MDPPPSARSSFKVFLEKHHSTLDSTLWDAGYQLSDSAFATAGLGPQRRDAAQQGRFTAGVLLFAHDTVPGHESFFEGLEMVSVTFGAVSDTGPWYLLTYRGAVEVPTDDAEMAHLDLQTAIREAFPTRPMGVFFRRTRPFSSD